MVSWRTGGSTAGERFPNTARLSIIVAFGRSDQRTGAGRDRGPRTARDGAARRLSAEAGLYAFIAGSLAFAVFGSNPYLSVGADSTIAPIFAGSLARSSAHMSGTTRRCEPARAGGRHSCSSPPAIARAGWIADLLSVPVTTGFLAGIAVHIVVGQLPALLGLADPTGSTARPAPAPADTARAHQRVRSRGRRRRFRRRAFGAQRINNRIPGALIGLAGRRARRTFSRSSGTGCTCSAHCRRRYRRSACPRCRRWAISRRCCR